MHINLVISCMAAKKYCLEQAEHFKIKANHNKSESLWCFKIIMFSTLSAPLLVSFGEGVLFAKLLPSILSAVAAFCTAWLQLRKPQELWSNYRNIQRQIEIQLTQCDFRVAEYQGLDENKANETLILNVSQLILQANSQWLKNVPDSLSLKIEGS